MAVDPERLSRFKKTLLIAILIGIISGFGSLLFFVGLKAAISLVATVILGYHMPAEGMTLQEVSNWTPPLHIWLILPIITLGGLASGLLIWRFAPEAAGHGTDAAIKAFHGDGRIRWRIPLLKAVTSIITISTGGSAGREGPTAQISAGFGSIMADLLHLSDRERRIAIATGIGAGIGTIFKAPLGGAILAGEILYKRDFESDAIIPAFLASIIGYSIFGAFIGFEPVFLTGNIEWDIPQIPFFILLGVVCALMGMLYVWFFYWSGDQFTALWKKYHIPPYLKPAFGAGLLGLMVVILAYFVPGGLVPALASLGSGYGFMQLAIFTLLPLSVLLVMPFLKIISTSLTISSGGSGGVFAPGLFIGAAVGGSLGTVLHILAPEYVPLATVPAFVVVGMIALFGSVSNAPIAVMIMVVEMTGNFSLLIPSMASVGIAAVITAGKTIYREQVETKADSGAHRGEYLVEILDDVRVSSVMTPGEKVISVSADQDCATVMGLIDQTWHTGFPVLQDDHLKAIVTVGDLRKMEARGKGHEGIGSCMERTVVTVTPEDTLETALKLMIEHRIHHLPVVAGRGSDRLVGFITTTDIMEGYGRRLEALHGEKESENSRPSGSG
ncbi:CIC family chloride channel protein [Methanolinea mesophila]|uniref:chloride channel protein n=1 Tax=Methanolinea mesophila TaxID=547055 RepID=UPI001AE277A8|nr:chloride channel protein [Methanolinea mesophila]MBP1928210.1 CIC family chloride channel protein [Methanolinea mesophila]